MDLLVVVIPLAVVLLVMQQAEQRQRILLLASHLQKYRIEHHLAQLTDGYLRAVGESDPERSGPIWNRLASTEDSLIGELTQLSLDLQGVWGERMRVSRLPMALPMVTRFFPQASFDFRALVALHARSLGEVFQNSEGLERRDRAFRATAELLLFQHSCHWFCRSKNMADARLMARHHTRYEQVLDGIAPRTREAYRALVQG